MIKKTARLIGSIGAVITAGSVHATLIASEGFMTTEATNDYGTGTSIATAATAGTTNGTFGFSANNKWLGAETTFYTYDNTLVPASTVTHNGITGAAASGSFDSYGNENYDKNSYRFLGAQSGSSTYFLSGLVKVDKDGMVDGAYKTAGFFNTPAGNDSSIATGFHYGLHNNGGQVYLAAFAGGQAFDMLPITTDGIDYQVVVRLNVNASGADTLTAWYAANGATQLTLGQAATNVETYASGADLQRIGLQYNAGATAGAVAHVYFDEIRLGTTLGDVTTIPEPTTVGLFALSGAITILVRRFKLR
jgi:hypothetical protein